MFTYNRKHIPVVSAYKQVQNMCLCATIDGCLIFDVVTVN